MPASRLNQALVAAAPTLALITILSAAGGSTPATSQPSEDHLPRRLNVIVVQTDDQTSASLRARTMPRLLRAVRRGGARFDRYVATTPLCCPSRATLLTGQYSHNHGVHSNRPGYPALRDKANVLPSWLKRAGYRTAHIGKFLHGLESARGDRPPPGWDHWVSLPSPRRYLGYALSEGGRRVEHGRRVADYITRVLNRRAVAFVRAHAGARRPFYLELDHFAPHHSSREEGTRCQTAATPDPRDERAVKRVPVPERSGVDEPDVADKPSFLQRLPRLGVREVRRLVRDYRCDMASLRAVDRGVGALLRELRRSGVRNRTVLIFVSDNGYLYGEHRIDGGKGRPYEESVHVPLAIAGPPRIVGRRSGPIGALAANIDLAPTIVDFADATPCRRARRCRALDGRSLRPLLTGAGPAWPAPRAVLLENLGGGNRARVGGKGRSCVWFGLRTETSVYVKHTRVPHPRSTPQRPRCINADEIELYDLRHDPAQLRNLGNAPAGPRRHLIAAFEQRLSWLRHCAGQDLGAVPARRPCE